MSLNDKLQNPLFAQKYYEDLASHMVSLEIHNDAILKNAGIKSIVDKTRLDSVVQAQTAARQKGNGKSGVFVSDDDEVGGSVLLEGSTVYVGPDFLLSPGPSTHFYLTTAVDPRSVPFPDKTAIDLGAVHDAYGAQTLTVPNATSADRTLVVYDTQLKKIFGFAQLAK